MRITKCCNGHFFDSDTYSQCPHCGASAAEQQKTPIPPEQKKAKKGIFGRKNKSTSVAQPQFAQSWPENREMGAPQVGPQGGFSNAWNDASGGTAYPSQMNSGSAGFDVTQVIPQNQIDYSDDEEGTTILSQQNASQPAIEDEVYYDPNKPLHPQPHSKHMSEEYIPDGTGLPSRTQIADSGRTIDFWSGGAPEQGAASVTGAQNTANNDNSELYNAVRQASAFTEGKTMSFFQSKTANLPDTDASNDASVRKALPEPTVGWLVCIKGDHFGMSFNIVAGMNAIGRNSNNKIVLNRSNTVSRDRHALIIYEPRQRTFYIKPGESSGLTYMNGEYITDACAMKAKDVIELGNNSLMLIPLCDETFNWEDYMTNR